MSARSAGRRRQKAAGHTLGVILGQEDALLAADDHEPPDWSEFALGVEERDRLGEQGFQDQRLDGAT